MRKMKHPSRKFASILLSLVIIISSLLVYLFAIQKNANAEWFDENWYYREQITITNNGSAQTNYQIEVIVDTQTLITNSKLQSSCNDLRFTDPNGKLYPYWIETGCNTTSTLVWVQVASIPTVPSYMYMYYANPSAPSVSQFITNPTGIDLGTGADGACSVTADTTISTGTCVGRGNADGINTTVSANTLAGQNQITVAATTGLSASPSDEILIINMQGTTSNNTTVGNFETAHITNIAGTTLTLNHNLVNSYDGTTQKIMVQRVPNYTTVSVSTGINFISSGWSVTKGGVIFFRANSSVTATGNIHANLRGYATGAGGIAGRKGGKNGESYDGSVGQGGDAGSANFASGGGAAGDDPTAN